MPEEIHTHTELLKLQHLLQDDTNELSFLGQLQDEELAKLRIKVSKSLQLEQSDVWARIGKVSGVMPSFLSAKVAETIFDPMITANVSYHVPIKTRLGIIKHLSVPFMGKVAEHLIPEKCVELLNELPMEVMKKMVTQLIKTKSHYTLAGFVDVTQKRKVIELSNFISKDEDLLLISHYVNNKNFVASIVEGFSDLKLKSLILKSVEINLHDELIVVGTMLPEREQKRMANILYHMPLSTLDALLKKAEELNVMDQLNSIKETLLKRLNIQ